MARNTAIIPTSRTEQVSHRRNIARCLIALRCYDRKFMRVDCEHRRRAMREHDREKRTLRRVATRIEKFDQRRETRRQIFPISGKVLARSLSRISAHLPSVTMQQQSTSSRQANGFALTNHFRVVPPLFRRARVHATGRL
jgi:hypothetical protein